MRQALLFLVLVIGSLSVSRAMPVEQDGKHYRTLMTRASVDSSVYENLSNKSIALNRKAYLDIQTHDEKYKWKITRFQAKILNIDNENPKEVVFRVTIDDTKEYNIAGLSVASSDVRVGDRVDVLGVISPGLLPSRDRSGKVLMIPFIVAAKLRPVGPVGVSTEKPRLVAKQATEQAPPKPSAQSSKADTGGRMVCTPRRTGGEVCEYVPGKDEHSIGASD